MNSNFLYRSHPWHGISLGEKAPNIVNCYIEMVPSDTIKYELDKETGILKVDRPHKYSSLCPTLYGFIPQTYAGEHVAEFCMQKTGLVNLIGDKDPIDVCIFTEKVITNRDLMLRAIPVGGFRLLDGAEVDDKIIAILEGDRIYENIKNIDQFPKELIERLRHYFLTYKDSPERNDCKVEIVEVFGKQDAEEIILRGHKDYLKLVQNFSA